MTTTTDPVTTEPMTAAPPAVVTETWASTDTPEDRLIDALGPEPDTDGLTPEEADQALSAWREQWVATNLEDADYAARRYRQCEARISEIEAVARHRITQIGEWSDRETGRHNTDLAYWAGRLTTFHRAARELDVKHNKTVSLPCGVELRSQAGKISVVVTDPDAATVWLEANHAAAIEYPPAQIVKREVAKGFGAKAGKEEGEYPAVDDNGEVIPGLAFVRSPVSYVIS